MSTINKNVLPTNNTIEGIGITKDPFCAIFEYIRNWFDAWATRIDIYFSEEVSIDIDYKIEIKDNWTWIDYQEFDNRFRPLLDSSKLQVEDNRKNHWKKWKGRFSFSAIANNVARNTCYKKNGKLYKYNISSSSINKENYIIDDSPKEYNSWSIWTSVILTDIHWVTVDNLKSDNFITSIKKEFWRYLELHKSRLCSIYINNSKIDYKNIGSRTVE